MTSERLAELQRQRDHLRDQLAALDHQIATGARELAPGLTSPPTGPDDTSVAALDEAYRPDPLAAAAQLRRGCLILALGAFLLSVAALAAIYFLRYRDHPLFGA